MTKTEDIMLYNKFNSTRTSHKCITVFLTSRLKVRLVARRRASELSVGRSERSEPRGIGRRVSRVHIDAARFAPHEQVHYKGKEHQTGW